MSDALKIVLTAVDLPLAEAWERFCGDLDFVSVYHGSIFDTECDAVVSPANSFGFMDGGIDLLYSVRFGWDLQERLQQMIRERHYGELLVGTAEIAETGNDDIPYLIAAPTMRVPMILRDSVNPFLAARAVLRLWHYGVMPDGLYAGELVRDIIETIAFPGLGTGVGQVAPDICARQMRAAIDETLLNSESFPASWRAAQLHHQALYTESFRDLQHD